MHRSRSQTRRRIRPAGLAVVLVLAGCGGGGPTEGRSVTGGDNKACVPAALIPVTTEADRLPKGLSLIAGAQVVTPAAGASAAALTVEAPGSVSDAYVAYKAQLEAAGYPVVKTDNEGREAELFYKPQDAPRAVIQMSTPACPAGVVRIAFSGGRTP